MYELMDLLVVVGAIVVLLGGFYGVQLRLREQYSQRSVHKREAGGCEGAED